VTFIDTNVLIYAQGAGAKGDAARDAILAGGVISVQVLNEFAAVLRRKLRQDWQDVAAAVADVRAALDPVRPIGVDTHEAALALAKDNGFGFYDALIVAAAIEAGCDLLLTEDLQAGRRIGNLTIANPFAGLGVSVP
jgi:predicted nucleic acid-binding protein